MQTPQHPPPDFPGGPPSLVGVPQPEPEAVMVPDPLLSRDEVKRLCSIKSDSTLYELIRRGAFPAPITLTDSGARVAWPQSRVAAWIEARKQVADQLGSSGRALGPKLRQLVAGR